MKRRTPRALDPEERDLWERIAKSATPLDPKRKSTAKTLAPRFASPRRTEDTGPIAPFEIGAKSATALPRNDLAPSISDQIRRQPIEMDKKAFRRLRRGQSRPEARLDLHGLTADAAHGALTRFIMSAHGAGKRLVLVITGKGRSTADDGPIPARVGILRHQVPNWLSRPPLSPLVLQVTEAHQRHGGSGALYVYLRRR